MINPMNIIRAYTPNRILLAIILLTPLAASAGVYKWTDADGNVHYGSERPADVEPERLDIKDGAKFNPYADPSEEQAKLEKEKADKELAKETTKQEAAKKAEATPPPVAEKPVMPKKEKNRRCQQARDSLASMQGKARLREVDEKGNYSYASEEQRQKRMALEKKDVSEYCK